jgi:hypothetical protein
MAKLSKPVNDWARCLIILHSNYMAGVSMAKVLNVLPHFYKFQTRLKEVEKAHPKLKISRTIIPFKNAKLNKNGYFTQYTLLSPPSYVINLYNKINKEGLYGEKKDKK